MHVFAPSELIFPVEHLVQLLIPILDAYLPDIQESQLVAPGIDAYLPACGTTQHLHFLFELVNKISFGEMDET